MHSIKCRYYLDGRPIIIIQSWQGARDSAFFQVYILNISDV